MNLRSCSFAVNNVLVDYVEIRYKRQHEPAFFNYRCGCKKLSVAHHVFIGAFYGRNEGEVGLTIHRKSKRRKQIFKLWIAAQVAAHLNMKMILVVSELNRLLYF